MKDNFRTDVSESLKRLHLVLLKKAKTRKLSPERFQKTMNYLNFLKIVAANTAAYCDPAYFDKNMKKLGFDVATDFNLLSLDESTAQCVYNIMVCRRDYICHTNKKNSLNGKKAYKYDFRPYRYQTQQEAVDEMRLFKRDSIEASGGFTINWLRGLRNKFFVRTR